jgi:hypothetical protein
VIDGEGTELEISVPRFECHGRGPRRVADRTFSVLPAEAIPRRVWSVSWMLKVALLCSDSLVAAMDRLSETGKVVEARQLSRVLEVLGIVCERLHEHPVKGIEVTPVGLRREMAVELARSWLIWQADGRDPPGALVMAWNTTWGSLLMDVRVR